MGPMPKSGPRFVLDKVRLMCSDLRCSTPVSMSEIKVPNKSLSHELKNAQKYVQKKFENNIFLTNLGSMPGEIIFQAYFAPPILQSSAFLILG